MGGGSSTNYASQQGGSASNLLAQIVQSQYQNYQALYQPIENQQIEYATNPNTILNAQQSAGAQAQQQFQSSQQGVQKGLETSGIQLNPTQQSQVSRLQQLQGGLGQVGAMNNAGRSAYDNITGVLTGSSPSPQSFIQGVSTAAPGG